MIKKQKINWIIIHLRIRQKVFQRKIKKLENKTNY